MTRSTQSSDRLWIVTGASGHLGNTVVRALAERGERVRAFVLEKERPEALRGLPCEVISGDITDPETLEPLFMNLKSPHVTVLHLASVVSIYAHASPMLFEVNVRGTRHLLDRSMAHGVDRFVYCGSVHALPVPDDPETIITEVDHYDPNLVVGDYAKSKAMAAEMVLDASRNGLDASVVLPAGIIGPYDYLGNSISGLLKRVVDRKLPAMIGGGYNFVSVKDVANGIIAAAERGRSGESYILSGHEVDALDMVNFVAQMTGRRTFRHLAPMWIARLIAPITEWLSKQTGRRPVLTPYSLYTLTSPRHFSHDKATRELGYTVRPLEETLTAMVRFMADNHQFKTAVVFENGS